MKCKKIAKVVFCVSISITLFIGMLISEKEDLLAISTLLGILIAYSIEASFIYGKDCFDNSTWKETLKLYLRKQKISKEDNIRISFAYLFRIKVDGKYLLVRNSRGTNKYQPVGGSYKVEQEEKLYLKDNFFVSDDDKIPIDESSQNDYRMLVPAKFLKKFVRRFNKTPNREKLSNLSREFKEELINTEILDDSEIKYRYCGRHITDLNFSRHFQCYELMLADVVEFLPTTEQETKLRRLKETQSDKYIFATKDEIEHCGIVEGTDQLKEIIGDHSFKILSEYEIKLNRIKHDRGCYHIFL